MNIKILSDKNEKKDFTDFIYKIYRNNPCYIDTNIFNLESLLYGKTGFAAESEIIPVQILIDKNTACQCLLIKNDRSPYLFAGYFDAEPDAFEAVEELKNFALEKARALNASGLIFGINGHVSLGTGILQNCFDEKISFDSLYCPKYYKDYFSSPDFKKVALHTYKSNGIDVPAVKFSKKEFSLRYFDFKNYGRDIALFQSLTNECLSDTDYYYSPDEGYFKELFSDFKLILKNKNIIFALHEGKEIGYIFWHPDFNKFLRAGKHNGALRLWLNAKCRRHSTVKINAIALKKEYRHTVAGYMLINELKNLTESYKNFETTFIWDSNINSVHITKKCGFKEHREYAVYIRDV